MFRAVYRKLMIVIAFFGLDLVCCFMCRFFFLFLGGGRGQVGNGICYVSIKYIWYKIWLYLIRNFSQKTSRDKTLMKHVPENAVSEEIMQKSFQSTEKIVSTMWIVSTWDTYLKRVSFTSRVKWKCDFVPWDL